MSYTPNEQHTVGDAEAGVKGPVVLGRNQATGLVAPLMGSEGDDNAERAPLTGSAGKTGAIGWLTLIWQVLNDVVSSVVSVSTGQAGQTSTIVTAIQQPQSVVPPHVGTNGDPFSVAVEEGYDTDNPVMYPLVLKAGTSQKQLMTSVEHTVGLTDTQIRATPLPVAPSLAADAATQTTLALIKTKTDNLDVAISTRTKPADQQHVLIDSPTGLTDTQLRATAVPVSATSLPLPALAATSTKQSDGTQKTQVVDGSGNVQPAGDTSGRAIKVDASATTQPISAVSLPLPTGAALDATLNSVGIAVTALTRPGDTQLVDGSAHTQPISAVSLPLPTGAAQDGTDQTFVGAPNGAVGVRGWLSAIYGLLVKWPTGITECGTLLQQLAVDGWNALTTYDVNMAQVFGSSTLLGPTGRLKTDPVSSEPFFSGFVNARSPIFSAPCSGYATATIQLGGTWTGTVTFEGYAAGGSATTGADPVVILFGLSPNGLAGGVQAVTVNGVYNIATTGFSRVQVRFSTATSGAPSVAITMSVQPKLTAAVLAGGVVNSITTVGTVNASRLVGNGGAVVDAVIGTGAAPANVIWTENAPATASAAALSVSANAGLAVANVKASAGNLYAITVRNPNASVIYIQMYNTAGTPTLGTGVVWWVPIAVGPFALGNFSTGIGIGASTTANSTGTPVSAPDVVAHYL